MDVKTSLPSRGQFHREYAGLIRERDFDTNAPYKGASTRQFTMAEITLKNRLSKTRMLTEDVIMKFKNLGTTISFLLTDTIDQEPCELLATYLPSDNFMDQFLISIQLRKYQDTPYEKSQEFLYQVDCQEISSSWRTIRSNISRIIDIAIETNFFDSYIREFNEAIRLELAVFHPAE